MRISFLLIPVIWTRLLAVVNTRSSHSLLYCVCMCLRVCVFLCAPVCISISVCGHMSRKAVAWPHRFHALFSSVHISSPTHLLPPGPPPSLLVCCPWRWFTSVTSGWAGSGRRPGEKRTSHECCVRWSRDGGHSIYTSGWGLGSMVTGLFAASFKKQREYVKHLIDLLAPSRPETMDKKYTIKNLVHINSHITWVDGSWNSWRKKGSS